MTHSLRTLLVLLSLAGCDDALGIAGDCGAEKTEVRLREGPPDDTERDEFADNVTEVWRYQDEDGRIRAYTFRWGASYGACDVSGPTTFFRAPEPDR